MKQGQGGGGGMWVRCLSGVWMEAAGLGSKTWVCRTAKHHQGCSWYAMAMANLPATALSAQSRPSCRLPPAASRHPPPSTHVSEPSFTLLVQVVADWQVPLVHTRLKQSQ